MTKHIVVVDCGSGNLRSVTNALAQSIEPSDHIHITSHASDLIDATHIVLPGVGAFGDCMNGLNALSGMRDALEHAVREQKKPFLGICVGMQMLFEEGHEFGVHQGLGWLKGKVKPMTPSPELKIPHMGWNSLHFPTPARHWAFEGLEETPDAYFVHSYHAVETDAQDVVAYSMYGEKIVAAVAKENILATQFHPEKSQRVGLCLLRHFVHQN